MQRFVLFLSIFMLLFCVPVKSAMAEEGRTQLVVKKVVKLLKDPNVKWEAKLYYFNPYLDAVEAKTCYKGMSIVVNTTQGGTAQIVLGEEDLISDTLGYLSFDVEESVLLREAVYGRWGEEIMRREFYNLRRILNLVNEYLNSQGDSTRFSIDEQRDVYALRKDVLLAVSYLHGKQKIYWEKELWSFVDSDNARLVFSLKPFADRGRTIFSIELRGANEYFLVGFPIASEEIDLVGLWEQVREKSLEEFERWEKGLFICHDFVKKVFPEDPLKDGATLNRLYAVFEDALFVALMRKSRVNPEISINKYGEFVVHVENITIKSWSRQRWDFISVESDSEDGYVEFQLGNVRTRDVFKKLYDEYYEKSGWAERERCEERLRNTIVEFFLKL